MSVIRQTGASTVEFALMLPLLLLLVAMVSEFGVMFYRLNALTKSVQIAARYLSDVSVNYDYTQADAANARLLAVYGSIAATTPVVPGFTTANIVATDLGEHVRVVATYDSSLILGSGLNTLMYLATGGAAATNVIQLKASSVMRFAQ